MIAKLELIIGKVETGFASLTSARSVSPLLPIAGSIPPVPSSTQIWLFRRLWQNTLFALLIHLDPLFCGIRTQRFFLPQKVAFL